MRRLQCCPPPNFLLSMRRRSAILSFVFQNRPSIYACLSATTIIVNHLRRSHSRANAELERRIDAIPLERFRNFCIVAHVDHGKSTRTFNIFSDRLLELTGTIKAGDNKQILDKLDVERERGITVKAQTCTMLYRYKDQDWLLHLVDTPGHVDFRAEVSSSYRSSDSALLLVDASQGVQGSPYHLKAPKLQMLTMVQLKQWQISF
jgi:GTPase